MQVVFVTPIFKAVYIVGLVSVGAASLFKTDATITFYWNVSTLDKSYIDGPLFERFKGFVSLTANENNKNITAIEFLKEMQVVPISSVKYNKYYQQSWLKCIP